MIALTEEHVADRGKVWCAWRGADVAVAECVVCPAARDVRVTAPTSAHPIETVRCSQPIPLA